MAGSMFGGGCKELARVPKGDGKAGSELAGFKGENLGGRGRFQIKLWEGVGKF